MEDDLKLQDFDQWVKIFILKHKGENLSKESKILGHPNGHDLTQRSNPWVFHISCKKISTLFNYPFHSKKIMRSILIRKEMTGKHFLSFEPHHEKLRKRIVSKKGHINIGKTKVSKRYKLQDS